MSLSEGGKASRSPRPRRVLQTSQSFFQVAVSPEGHGVAITIELGGDLKIGGLILVGRTENQPATEDQGLWSGTRSNQGLQLSALQARQRNNFREWERHE
jgi:hypothetical protein